MKKDEEMILRDTVIEVDLDRIAGNMRAIKAMVGEKTAVAGVVKADGYGHGAVGIAKTLMGKRRNPVGGCNAFGGD